MSHKIFAIVPAAGSGTRFGGPTPKQYLSLGNKTIIEHSLAKLKPFAEKLVVALAPDDQYFSGLHISQDTQIVTVDGGDSRAESVTNALLSLDADDDDWVLVHDAVRPLVSPEDIQHLIDELKGHESGGLLAIPVHDTVKRANSANEVTQTEDRDGLWLAQTPQMFKIGPLKQALAATAADETITDESLAMEKSGYAVKLVKGSTTNFKVTRPEDLGLAELLVTIKRSIN